MDPLIKEWPYSRNGSFSQGQVPHLKASIIRVKSLSWGKVPQLGASPSVEGIYKGQMDYEITRLLLGEVPRHQNVNHFWKLEYLSGKTYGGIWCTILWRFLKKHICFTSYMCLPGVETFPLLVAVPLLGECMAMCLWDSLYYFIKILLFSFFHISVTKLDIFSFNSLFLLIMGKKTKRVHI